MTAILTFAMKIIWWALPKLAGNAIDQLGNHLAFVEAANAIEDTAARRESALGNLRQSLPLPESFIRAYLEILVIMSRIGVTAASLEAMEILVRGLDSDSLLNETKRNEALKVFRDQYSDVPESVARLLIELAVVKVRSTVGVA